MTGAVQLHLAMVLHFNQHAQATPLCFCLTVCLRCDGVAAVFPQCMSWWWLVAVGVIVSAVERSV